MRTILFLTLGLVLSASPLRGETSLLANGSFEEHALVEGDPNRGRGPEPWTLERSRFPTHWILNAMYPGRLSIHEDGAAHGRRCVTVSAGTARDAQLFQALPRVRTDRWYRLDALVRGGAASILVYEYRKDIAGPTAKVVASVSAPGNAWRPVTGFYCPTGEDFASLSIALLVPRGRSATIDNVTVTEMEVEPPPGHAPSCTFENSDAKLVLDARGHLRSLVDKANRRELAEGAAATTFLTAVRGGVRYPVNSVAKGGRDLVVSFVDPEVKVRLGVTKRRRHFEFEVRRAQPADIESLEFALPVTPLATRSHAANGTWDDRTGLCLRAVSPNGECRMVTRGRALVPTVAWYRRHGMEGGRSALVTTAFPRFLAAIEEMEQSTGLPSPRLPDRWGGDGKEKRRWARLSPAVGRSYLFVTGYAPGDVDFLIDAAKTGGFDLLLFLDSVWKRSAGHYAVREDNFPGGVEGIRAVGEKIHEAGLGFGLHFVGATVGTNDAYVTPRPDPRLLGLPCGGLAKAVEKDATTFPLTGVPECAPLLGRPPGRFPDHYLQVGNEIVKFGDFVPGPPARFTGVVRGALGTTPAAHRKGSPVRSLPMAYGCFLVDPDSDIVSEIAGHLAGLVNEAGVDMVYFDAIGTIDPASGIDTWYYWNRLLPGLCARFGRDVLVQTSLGPGWQMLWHLVPRAASADGHGDLKGYLDRRLPSVRAIRQSLSAADVGWYALDLATERDQLEYVAGRCLALGASISVQANRHVLTQHPRAREILELLERYERCRLTGGVPAAGRESLMTPGRDHRLLEPEPGRWRLFCAEYEPVRAVTSLDAEENVVSVENDGKTPVALEMEIGRERQVATPRDCAAAAVLEGFDDLALYEAGDTNRYPEHVAGAEGVLVDGGLVRRDVAADFARREGDAGVVLTARNGGRGGGWMARGRRFDPPRDLTGAAAFAVRVQGDGRGQTLILRFVDRAGAHRNLNVPIGFSGWRLRTFPRPAGEGFDWKAVEYLVIVVTRIPRETDTTVRLGALRMLRTVRAPSPLAGLSVAVGGKEYPVPTALAPGETLTIDALGRGVLWPGGMSPGRRIAIAGGPITIPPGRHTVRLVAADPESYPGDVLLRVSRQWE